MSVRSSKFVTCVVCLSQRGCSCPARWCSKSVFSYRPPGKQSNQPLRTCYRGGWGLPFFTSHPSHGGRANRTDAMHLAKRRKSINCTMGTQFTRASRVQHSNTHSPAIQHTQASGTFSDESCSFRCAIVAGISVAAAVAGHWRGGEMAKKKFTPLFSSSTCT